MASRSHVDVNERRLRPIYDCLDNGNNKKAIQEADKVLKKQKDLHCAKVLKALALLRLGRHDESMAILQEVHNMHPTNEATLTAMSICYREIHKLDLIADMYENAHKSRPDSEEILSSLFMAHVRLCNYKKQQLTAMQLHKLRPQNNPYYFWAVMSIVMQAHSTPDKTLAKTMYLPLAAKMTEKYVSTGKVEVESEVMLYIMILELLEKWDDIITVLQGPLSGKISNEFLTREAKMAMCHQKMCRWEKANELYKQLLEKFPDQYSTWKDYLETVLQLESGGSGSETSAMENGEEGAEKTVDDTVEKAVAFMIRMMEEKEEGGGAVKYRARGPYLAQLHLHSLLRHHKTCQAPEQLGSPMECLQQYFNLFGDKPCCPKDMMLFVDLLSKEEQRDLMEHLRKSLHLESEDGSVVFVEDVRALYRHLTVLMLNQYLGLHDDLSPADKVALACELIKRYYHGLEFGKNLLSTEFQYADNYLIVAIHLMARAYEETGDQKLIWQMIVQLELGTRKSPSNYHFKILLIKLYCTMGAFGPCPGLYDSMEIKHIMNDTLGNVVSNHVGRLGYFVAACAMYGTMLRFFTVNHKETVEYLLTSYKYGSFKQIPEFVQFREKLQNSMQYASATAERLLLDMILDTNSHHSSEQMVNYMEIDPDKEKTNYDTLMDNRDFTTIHCWDPPSRFRIQELQAQSFEEEKAWLHVRNLVLRMLACAVQWGRSHGGREHASNGGGGEEKCRQDVLSSLLEELCSHLESCQHLAQPHTYPLYGPFRTRISTYLQGGHHSIFTGMVDNCLYVGTVAENGADKTDKEKEEKLQNLIPTLMEELVTKVKASLLVGGEGDPPQINIQALENLALAAETLSHVTVLAGVCSRLLKPLKTTWSKKHKKKKEPQPPEPPTLGSFSRLVERLQTVAKELHKQVSLVDPVFMAMDLSQLSLSQPLMPDKEDDEQMEKEVWKNVANSYQQSAREIRDLIHCKMLYLNELAL